MFDQQDFQSANMFLGITDEQLCIQALQSIKANGLGKSGQRILNLSADATIAQVIERVEEYGAVLVAETSWEQENVDESIAWLKAAAAKVGA